jgi:hypothetical protein
LSTGLITAVEYLQKSNTLFDNAFLQEGQIVRFSSLLPPVVEEDDRSEGGSSVNLTGNRLFKL